MKKILKLLFLVTIATNLQAQDVGIDSLKVKANIRFLASDLMKGRKINTIENEMVTEYLETEFIELNLEPCMNDSYKVPLVYDEKTAFNVCGKKQGSSDEILIVSAHFDHIGVDENLDGDQIFNGADDNASGVTAVIGIADYLKNMDTKRTIWFVGFNAEEVGLVGSTQFVNQMEEANLLEKVVAVFNFEMLGTISNFGKHKVFMTGDERSDFDELINQNQDKIGIEVIPDPYKKYNLFNRSDNAPFAKKGVLAHSFSSCEIERGYYHQTHDDLSVINIPHLTVLIEGMAKSVEIFANDLDLKPTYSR